jgi:tetratricopeptide (TPR) repeat protein
MPTPDEEIQRAKDLVRDNKRVEAQRCLEGILEWEDVPRDTRTAVWIQLADLHYHEKRYPEAIVAYERALGTPHEVSERNRIHAKGKRATALGLDRQYLAAAEAFRLLVDEEKGLSEGHRALAYYERGMALTRGEKLGDAAAVLQECVNSRSLPRQSVALARYTQASNLAKLGRYKPAIEAYKGACQMHRHLTEEHRLRVHLELGEVQGKNGDYQDAVHTYETLLQSKLLSSYDGGILSGVQRLLAQTRGKADDHIGAAFAYRDAATGLPGEQAGPLLDLAQKHLQAAHRRHRARTPPCHSRSPAR